MRLGARRRAAQAARSPTAQVEPVTPEEFERLWPEIERNIDRLSVVKQAVARSYKARPLRTWGVICYRLFRECHAEATRGLT